MDQFVRHTQDVGRGVLSPELWKNCPVAEIMVDPNKGIIQQDFFSRGATFASATEEDGYITVQDAGVTIKGLATKWGGALQIAGADADNDEGVIEAGAGVIAPFRISDTAGENWPLWFEANFEIGQITETGLFVGLAQA